MDSPSSASVTVPSTKIVAKSSVIDSIKGCSLGGIRIPKEELRQKITMPEYLRLAIRDSVAKKNVDAGMPHYDATLAGGTQPLVAPESPLVVFVNSKSGGRHGPELKARLQELMGEEQVCDLKTVKPHEFIQFGLGCLEKFASLGDQCAKETRERLRVVVAGGDGTVGWILGCLGDLPRQGREPVPPTAIIPLGTGNDLSRSFGWGGSFPFNWKQAIKKTLDKASTGPVSRLDSWNLTIAMPSGHDLEAPHSLKPTEDVALDQGLEVEGLLPEKVSCYNGVFYNYFSIGMDAQVAYGFHHLRNEKPYLAQGPVSNKLIYSGYSCKQGWFFTPCINDPSLRGLKNILRLHVKKFNSTIWEIIPIPSSVRSIVALNLHSYGSGRNPWGTLKPDYLEKKGFVEAHADDGILEVFGFKQGWHASFVMVELISAIHIAQDFMEWIRVCRNPTYIVGACFWFPKESYAENFLAQSIKFELRGGAWKEAFMQMDGEPWKQPMNSEFSTFVEITRVPFQSFMVKGE